MDGSTPVWQLSVDEIKSLIDDRIAPLKARSETETTPELVYGLDGICKLFGVTKPVAIEIKNSNEFKRAIYQRGRTIITNTVIAKEIMFGKR